MHEQFTREQAIEFHDKGAWKDLSYRDRAVLQMAQEKLCMPFGIFHEAIEQALGRPVFTHEFGLNSDGLKKELMGEALALSLAEIMDLIPADKRIVIVAPGQQVAQGEKGGSDAQAN